MSSSKPQDSIISGNLNMKTNLATKGSRGRFRSLVIAAAMLSLGGLETVCTAGPFDSPVGPAWDCVMSGSRKGLASITFSGDGSLPGSSFTGFEILVPKFPKQPSSSSGRGGSGDGRTGTDGNTGTKGTQIFGSPSNSPSGPWSFDSKGRVIGFFAETAPTGPCVTNVVTTITVETNGSEVVVSSNSVTVIDCPAITNSISFVGKVFPGKRLTLVCSTPFGKVTYRGVPTVPLADISGPWYGIKKTSSPKQSFTEFFTLAPNGVNIYDFESTGPGYTYSGALLVSRQKKIAIVAGLNPDFDFVRAVTGPYLPGKGKAMLRGWDQPAGSFTNRIQFNVTRQ
jgi:hypothetical protein